MEEAVREEEQQQETHQTAEKQLEGGSYEIIRKRLLTLGSDLLERINKMNDRRKEVFGALVSKVLRSDRIMTRNNCIPRDMVSVGNRLIFGYNVFIGLKKESHISDVFSVYEMKNDRFEEAGDGFLSDPQFLKDFRSQYVYYKDTRFATFQRKGSTLLMVFQVGNNVSDVKVFKWHITDDGSLTYVDSRSDREYSYPDQHDFAWNRSTRDNFVYGTHPHVSIEDRVFVETVGGDLTIKIEDNTESGEGIYSEPVENALQKLEDAEIYYAIMGSIILLKILPYQEEQYRYIIFDEKRQVATRVDELALAAVRLPEDDGLIFPGGYYLLDQGYKAFNIRTEGMKFLKMLPSPNGEDYLHVFYHEVSGEYILLQYNLINKQVESPITCHGFALYDDGTMVFFKAGQEAQKSHAIQVWQTPFVSDMTVVAIDDNNYMARIGNSELVRGISELRSIYNLIRSEHIYLGLYHEILNKVTGVLDMYYWMDSLEVFDPHDSLTKIRSTAKSAIDEYEKVVQIRQKTEEKLREAECGVEQLISSISTLAFDSVEKYVDALSQLQIRRGEIISLKELRYVDLARVEQLETDVSEYYDRYSNGCIDFLLREDALIPFTETLDIIYNRIPSLTKSIEMEETGQELDGVNNSLDLLTELVNTLKIDDATQTARIIENLSTIYSRVNQLKAVFNKHRKSLTSQEVLLEFTAQFKLINQTVTNFLDQASTPEKCEDLLTKVMIQIEELEGKFSDFDDYLEKLAAKREEVYSTFQNKKVQLEEALNKKTNRLLESANRILNGISNRLSTLKSIEEINGYFASDRMVVKTREIVWQLFDLGDSIKAEDIAGRLKSLQQDGIRQLKDQIDLYDGGGDLIRLGNFQFTVNRQKFGLTTVQREGIMAFHLTGTEFFEPITDETFQATHAFWNQDLVSETDAIYRAEYLAYKFLLDRRQQLNELIQEPERLFDAVREFMTPFFDEGYEKGVHDRDCATILQTLYPVYQQAGTLRFHSKTRAYAAIFWLYSPENKQKLHLQYKIRSLGQLCSMAEGKGPSVLNPHYRLQLQNLVDGFFHNLEWETEEKYLRQVPDYLLEELQDGDDAFAVDNDAYELCKGFKEFLVVQNVERDFVELLKSVDEDLASRLSMIQDWLGYFFQTQNGKYDPAFLLEAATIVLRGFVCQKSVEPIETKCVIENLLGDHPAMQDSKREIDLSEFLLDLHEFHHHTVPQYRSYQKLKRQLAEDKQEEMRLSEFTPRILTTFVRNKLIDRVYLPLIGANLAKQIGAYGEGKRTDLMGLLLLISPPGYGKTTLMEYIANRLGLIFMKINGPAIGNQVTSLDPSEATNATAREEVQKLNLAFEMGSNVMLYIDDIQHTNPEFLQKFISLCDAQRKIEGVYRGRTRTYDLRGKKFCVVMAGNPYTESGEKFQVPDMLANRADTYNLGDVVGGNEDVFNLSYLENSLTSNAVLSKLITRSQHDVYEMIKIAQTGSFEGADFEVRYAMEETREFVSVLEKMLRIQEIVLQVNNQYIYSAGQDDAYRKEPPFLLQGSYRNMNKMAEKILPIMNDEELQQVILDHYADESQLLTTGAEFNLLRFKEMTDWLSEEETTRLAYIRKTFQRNKALGNVQEGDPMSQLMGHITVFNEQFSDFIEIVDERLKNNVIKLRVKKGSTTPISQPSLRKKK
ncbi:AAA family ATPase [candidate division KSB3 bacterium]|uniref:AAA family ATPase n=1 Tax=candidate division KSB3 bacterium TaxID=2044937 RepID=A0A2G6KBS8_9BACT|nr:MAG: AAA family ATPase [candidate division KSB3 bacterium]